MKRILLLLILMLVHIPAVWSQSYIVQQDLQPQWLVAGSGQYTAYETADDKCVKAIYLLLGRDQYVGTVVFVQNNQPVSIFINGQLYADQVLTSRITIDSLPASGTGSRYLLAIYAPEIINPKHLKTSIITPVSSLSTEIRGPVSRFNDPVHSGLVVGLLLLAMLFVLLLRLNVKQFSYYLSPAGVFSQRDTDDTQALFRIAGSANLLFYVFAAMLSGFVLVLCLKDLTGQFAIASRVASGTWIQVMLSWFKLSVIIFLFLLVKGLFTYIIAGLFGMPQHTGFQFLDFVRIVILIMLVLGILQSVTYLYTGHQGSVEFYQAIGWVLGLWIAVLFIKMVRRTSVPVFHLFLYICATEIIPFLFVVKVLYE
jgi:hypothetical protein